MCFTNMFLADLNFDLYFCIYFVKFFTESSCFFMEEMFLVLKKTIVTFLLANIETFLSR